MSALTTPDVVSPSRTIVTGQVASLSAFLIRASRQPSGLSVQSPTAATSLIIELPVPMRPVQNTRSPQREKSGTSANDLPLARPSFAASRVATAIATHDVARPKAPPTE